MTLDRFPNLKLSRRRLLGSIALLSGGLFAGAGCGKTDEAPAPGGAPEQGSHSALHRAIREHFAYLSIDDQVIEAFARDLTDHQGAWNPRTAARPFTRFLASTDFFQRGADETRPLRYVSYYDPYVSSCYNPFADPA